MTDMSEQKDLEVLFPDREVTVKGEKLVLHPFYFGQLARVARLVKPIVFSLLSSGLLHMAPDASDPTKTTISLDTDFIPKLFDTADDIGEPLMELVAFGAGKERAWLNSVPADEGILLTQKVWEINSDFFVKRVLPMLGATFTKSLSTGATSSQGSSEQATAAPT